MNTIIVDGYNMLLRVPDLSRFLDVSLERGRDELLARIKNYLIRRKVSVIVVFDGGETHLPPAGNNFKRLTVLFSAYPKKADPLIKDLIRRADNKKGVILVSDDGELRRFAADNGSGLLTTAEFHALLARPMQSQEIYNKFDRELTQEELDEWLRLFGEK
ncbi:MAG: hypothetical protein D6743_16115 [Calditrichaeota bacterium]|nr:MAG: hypothetical protein D6743_16115 [Calditrichota bacterium]